MAFYAGSFGAYPFSQSGSCPLQAQSYPAVQYGSTGLASYAGLSQPSQFPASYYPGPSYSTTSDQDFYTQQQQQNAANLAYYAGSTQVAPNLADPYAQQTFSQQFQQATQSAQPEQAAVGQELAQLQPQIDAAYEAATCQRRQPVIKRQVITIPGAPGRVQQVVRRLPTPTPDIVERVFVVKPQRDVVNLIIERPCTPPVQFRDRTILGKQRKPVINPMIVRVQTRAQQPAISYVSQPCQALPAPSTIQQQQQSVSTHQQLTQCSQSQLQAQQHSQANLAATAAGGFVVAPVQYSEQQLSPQYQSFSNYGQQQQQQMLYGAGYSTGFPAQSDYLQAYSGAIPQFTSAPSYAQSAYYQANFQQQPTYLTAQTSGQPGFY